MKKKFGDYQFYTLQDLINDESFMLWISQPTDELDKKWENIQRVYPDRSPVIHEAREIVLSMRFETEILDEQQQTEIWNTIIARTKQSTKASRKIKLWRPYAAAAVLIGVFLAVGLLYSGLRQVNIHTAYGQLQTLTLPDGSQVTLNANSDIKYDRHWDDDETREVWVKGEAFFKVIHLHKNGPVKNHQRFVVHIGALNVEVLGTSFNVNNRRGHTEVALVEGKIGLGLPNKHDKPLILAPGDIVAYAQGKLNKKSINVGEYTAWKDGNLYFRNVPLAAIFNYLEDIYGYKVRVDDPKILTRRISGSVSSKNEKVLIDLLSITFGLNITTDSAKHELIIKAN